MRRGRKWSLPLLLCSRQRSREPNGGRDELGRAEQSCWEPDFGGGRKENQNCCCLPREEDGRGCLGRWEEAADGGQSGVFTMPVTGWDFSGCLGNMSARLHSLPSASQTLRNALKSPAEPSEFQGGHSLFHHTDNATMAAPVLRQGPWFEGWPHTSSVFEPWVRSTPGWD